MTNKEIDNVWEYIHFLEWEQDKIKEYIKTENISYFTKMMLRKRCAEVRVLYWEQQLIIEKDIIEGGR